MKNCYLCENDSAMYHNNDTLLLTDTDLLPRFADELRQDYYQLFYGLFLYSDDNNAPNTNNVYNLIASLWNGVSSPYLKVIHAKKWKAAILETRNALLDIVRANPDYSIEICIPFMYINGRAKRLLGNYDVAVSLLDSLIEDHPETLPIEEASTYQYPIKTLTEYFLDFKQKEMLKAEVEGEDVRQVELGIDYEMEQRLICPYVVEMEEDVQKYDLDYYNKTYFIEKRYADIVKQNQSTNPFDNTSPQDSNKRRAGVLRFMLESFGVRDKELCRKLIHYALVPDKPYSVKTDSNDTIYSYLHNDKQFYGSVDAIKEKLQYYSVDIPQGLIDIEDRKQKEK